MWIHEHDNCASCIYHCQRSKKTSQSFLKFVVLLFLFFLLSIFKQATLVAETRPLTLESNGEGASSYGHATKGFSTMPASLLEESVHILGGLRKPVVRWYDSPIVGIVSSTTDNDFAFINALFAEIALYTGIAYQMVSLQPTEPQTYLKALEKTPAYNLGLCESSPTTPICANFVVVISSKGDMHNIAKTLPLRPVFQRATKVQKTNLPDTDILCFFSPGIARGASIVRSVVFVDKDLDTEMRKTCLREEIFQSFGLFGDYSDSRFFSFNNQVTPKPLTAYDKRLLTSLYDNAIKSGASSLSVAKQVAQYCKGYC